MSLIWPSSPLLKMIFFAGNSFLNLWFPIFKQPLASLLLTFSKVLSIDLIIKDICAELYHHIWGNTLIPCIKWHYAKQFSLVLIFFQRCEKFVCLTYCKIILLNLSTCSPILKMHNFLVSNNASKPLAYPVQVLQMVIFILLFSFYYLVYTQGSIIAVSLYNYANVSLVYGKWYH